MELITMLYMVNDTDQLQPFCESSHQFQRRDLWALEEVQSRKCFQQYLRLVKVISSANSYELQKNTGSRFSYVLVAAQNLNM